MLRAVEEGGRQVTATTLVQLCPHRVVLPQAMCEHVHILEAEPTVREQKMSKSQRENFWIEILIGLVESWAGRFCGFSCKVVLKGIKK